MSSDTPTCRIRVSTAQEIGGICHAKGITEAPTYCRAKHVSQDADRALERKASVSRSQ
jgi:hypothetical protein